MSSKNQVKNAYKGLLLNFYFDLKKVINIGIIITLSLYFFNFIITIIFLNFNNSNTTENSGGLLVGFFTMLITLFVYVINSTSKEELHSKFAFPINRNIFAVSNFLSILIGAFVMMVITTILFSSEILFFRFFGLLTDKLIYLNTVTPKWFVYGFISSWAYMVTVASVAYCVFLFIRKHTLYALPVVAILLTSMISFGWIGDISNFLFLEQNLFILLVKLFGITVLSHVLGYIPLKRMEVA